MTDKDLKKLRDLYVKIGNVFKGCIFFPTGYVIDSNPENYFQSTNSLLKLEDNYHELLLEAYFTESSTKIVIVPDIKTTKNDLFNIDKVNDENIVSKKFDTLSKMINLFNNVDGWYEFRLNSDDDINDELFSTLFEKQLSVEFKPDDSKDDFVILGKSLFPLITYKNYKHNLRYHDMSYNDSLNMILFEFNFTHFKINQSFVYINLV